MKRQWNMKYISTYHELICKTRQTTHWLRTPTKHTSSTSSMWLPSKLRCTTSRQCPSPCARIPTCPLRKLPRRSSDNQDQFSVWLSKDLIIKPKNPIFKSIRLGEKAYNRICILVISSPTTPNTKTRKTDIPFEGTCRITGVSDRLSLDILRQTRRGT